MDLDRRESGTRDPTTNVSTKITNLQYIDGGYELNNLVAVLIEVRNISNNEEYCSKILNVRMRK